MIKSPTRKAGGQAVQRRESKVILGAFVTALCAIIVVLCLSSVLTLVASGRAHATVPGENGKIVFGRRPIGISTGDTTSGDIYSVNPDGSGLKNLTSGLHKWESDPAASPDGTKIAFVSNNDDYYDHYDQIFVMNVDGSGVTQLTNGSGDHTSSPVWSPDGKKIAFIRDGVIYMIGSNGSGLSRVFDAKSQGVIPLQLSWSPDGQEMAFSGRVDFDTVTYIYSVGADGQNFRQLTDQWSPGNSGDGVNPSDASPSWSPDGSQLLFIRNCTVWKMGANGESQQNIGSADGYCQDDPTWSPDGSRILYESESDFGLYTMDPSGNGVTLVANSPDDMYRDADWAVAQPPDTAKPSITRMRPGSGSTVFTRKPKISATVIDDRTDLTRDDIEIYLDGRSIANLSYSATGHKIVGVPGSNLSYGRHAVRLLAHDDAGNLAEARWSFRVARR